MITVKIFQFVILLQKNFSDAFFYSVLKCTDMESIHIFSARVVAFSKAVFRFLGLFPLFVKRSKASSNSFIKLWSIFWIILIFVYFAIVIKFQGLIFNVNRVGKVNDILKVATVSFAHLVFIIESLSSIRQFKKIHKLLMNFNHECKSLGVDLRKYKIKAENTFAAKFICILVMQVLVEVFTWLMVDSFQWEIFWYVNVFPAFMCRFRHLQYIFSLQSIQSRIDILNYELTKLVSDSRNSSRDVNEMLERLQTIKDAYGVLWKVVFEVNERWKLDDKKVSRNFWNFLWHFSHSFPWSLAANLIQNFVQIGCDSYWTYIALLRFPHDEAYKTLSAGIISPIILIVIVLKDANRIKTESREIPIQLHSIRKRKNEVELYKMVSNEEKAR